MLRPRRFHIRKPHIRLYDTTGLAKDVQNSLNLVILAVTFSMVFTNITTGAAWTSYQRMLGADSLMLGIISAIPVTASTLQIIASYVLERTRKRRSLFLVFGLISRLGWVVIGLIPVLVPVGSESMRLFALMAMLALSAGSGAFINVSFYSLMGDLVPLRIRGRYFSARQAVSLLSGIVTGLFVSWLMDRAEGFTGYMIVLVIAGVFGALDICCFFKVHWPAMQKPGGKREGFVTMLRGVLKDRPYMKIVGYFTLWFFAVNIAAPFTNVYFLEQVQMTFTEITIINQILPNIATVLVIGWWGRQMDRYGNQPIVQTAGLYCMLLPLAYVFTGPRSFLILPLANILSGMAWPASDLGQQNMYLAKAPAHNRSMYVAVFFASTQLFGTALSNFAGGILMEGPLWSLEALGLSLAGFRMTRYDFLFILSSLLRMGCVLLLLPHLRQEGDTKAKDMWRALLKRLKTRVRHLTYAIRIKRIRAKYRKENKQQDEGIHEEETGDGTEHRD